MQPGAKSLQINRARNLRDLGSLGDPERWGAIGRIIANVPADQDLWSPQIVRVQFADLAARAWDMFCHWRIEGLLNGDVVDRCSLEVSLGVGQATDTAYFQLVNGMDSRWENSTRFGNVESGVAEMMWPTPGAAVAIRAVMHVSGQNAPHAMRASFFVCVAPRAL